MGLTSGDESPRPRSYLIRQFRSGLPVIGLACLIGLGGCGTAQQEPKESAAFLRNENLARELIAGIRVENGISYSDATKIANYYLSRFAASQGAALMSLAETEREWEGRVMSTTSGMVLDALIHVDKKTGGVRFASWPTFHSIQELLAGG